MSLPQSVADVLHEHVTLEVDCIDRLYLNAYVPPLQYESGVAAFFRQHRGHPFASSALMDPISKAFVAAIHGFVQAHSVPLITFEKGQRKDDVMAAHLARFTAPEGLLFVGALRRRRGWSGRAATRRRVRPIRGWCARPPWSTTSTSTGWIATSGRSS